MSDFTQIFRDDFNGSSLDRGIWKSVYSGEYWNGMFRWDPSQLEVADGKLTIATENEGGGWVSGGASTIPDGQAYGSYEFRARMDAGQGTAAAILLWPQDGQWTDEVDIIEAHRPQRDGFAFVNHGDPTSVEDIPVNLADWHTYRLDWTPGALALSVDGQEVRRITADVPSQPMSFGMQAQVMGPNDTWFGGAPDASTPGRVELEVDWVKVSAWTPGQGTAPAIQPATQAATQPDAWTSTAAVAAGADTQADAYWMDAARRYIDNDGTWDGSWRNQVAAGQITLQDVAARIQAGEGRPEFWQQDGTAQAAGAIDATWLDAARRYIENDGTWEGSWRNQVAAGQITIDDVASRIAAGEGQWALWN